VHDAEEATHKDGVLNALLSDIFDLLCADPHTTITVAFSICVPQGKTFAVYDMTKTFEVRPTIRTSSSSKHPFTFRPLSQGNLSSLMDIASVGDRQSFFVPFPKQGPDSGLIGDSNTDDDEKADGFVTREMVQEIVSPHFDGIGEARNEITNGTRIFHRSNATIKVFDHPLEDPVLEERSKSKLNRCLEDAATATCSGK
jgi:hypothetical protein